MPELSPELLALLKSGQIRRLRIEVDIEPDSQPVEPAPLVKITVGPVSNKRSPI